MTDQTDGTARVTRRRLLKASSGTAIGVIGLSGSAFGHPPEEVRFCGCSRVSVRTTKSYRILTATETSDGYTCRLDRSTDAAERRESGWFVAEGEEKIVGVLGGSRNLFWNPNPCAQRAIDTLDPNECFGCHDDDCDEAVAYEQLGPHRYGAVGVDTVVRTRRCHPPAKWETETERSDSSHKRPARPAPRALGPGLNPPR